jgi:hypothetical protein
MGLSGALITGSSERKADCIQSGAGGGNELGANNGG